MAVLIYDSECPYCTFVARWAARFGGIELLGFQTAEAQRMLDALFDDAGFTMFFVTGDEVSWGDEAAKAVAEHIGLPRLIARFFKRHYKSIAKLFSVMSGRDTTFEAPGLVCDECALVNESGGAKMLSKNEKSALAEIL